MKASTMAPYKWGGYQMDWTNVLPEALAALAALISVVVIAVRLAVKQSEKALDGERHAREELMQELRRDLKHEKEERMKAETRANSNAAKLTEYMTQVRAVQLSLDTTIREIAALRETVTKLETELENERDEKARAQSQVVELKTHIDSLVLELKTRTIERDTLRDLIRGRLDAAEPREQHEAATGAEQASAADPQPAGEG